MADSDAKTCPGPFDGFPDCEKKIQWYLGTKKTAWFAENNMYGSRCSIQEYLGREFRLQAFVQFNLTLS